MSRGLECVHGPTTRRGLANRSARRRTSSSLPKVLCAFGTRPEVIKLAPVIQELQRCSGQIQTVTVTSGQHTDLVKPLLRLFGIQPDFDLAVMQKRQTPTDVCARVMKRFAPIIESEKPDLVVVQGDTTTAMAVAVTAFNHRVAVAHVEAGLRSGNPISPFPEEMNRRLITQMAKYHFAATQRNRETLLQEGVRDENVFVTGNPVVDSLQYVLANTKPSKQVWDLLESVKSKKLIVLTTHRRESFGETMRSNLRDIRSFVEKHEDVAVVFAVHPNPNVTAAAKAELDHNPRILQVPPLEYIDFVQLLGEAWLIVSDSGGIQEEAPTLGKPLFVLRNNTERPEAIDAGVAFLVGDRPGRLAEMLHRAYEEPSRLEGINQVSNPFGDGLAAKRIAELIRLKLHSYALAQGGVQ